MSSTTTALDKVIKEQGRQIAWVSGNLGVHYSVVSKWRSGARRIPEQRITELAKLLGVSEESLR
jgi:DNA-binding transcriptional regulator YdaS (Cro superfamily)